MATIDNAPLGEDTSLDGTERFPVSGSKYALVSSILAYVRTAVATLTNKTINLASNTLTGTTAEFNTALSDGNFATQAGTETLTNKTVNLSSNTLTGTTAQFNTALSDGDFATLAGSETLTNKTLTAPTIASFTNATHNHEAAAGGGTLDEDALALTDVTTNNSSTSKHGFLKKLDNDGTHFMDGQGNWSVPSVAGAVATDAIWDAKGDLAGGTGANTAARLAVGTNGQVLVADSAETTGMKWSTVAGTGDVVGPGSATDNAVARFDSTTGKLIQNSAATVDDNGTVNIPTGQTYNINGSAHTHSYAPNAFATIAVSGQSDVVADSTADTLTLAAGSNVTITTNAGSDTVTIAAAGGTTEYDYVEITSPVSVTATSEGTANTVITGNSVAYDGSTRVCIEFFTPRAKPDTAAAGRYIVFVLLEDSTVVGQIALLRTPAAGSDDKTVLSRRFRTPSNASHTYTVKAWVSAGTGTVDPGTGGTGADIPAYLRVTRA